MTYLPDVNVWIALYSPGHIHYSSAHDWFNHSVDSDLVFCRVTQMGFLRLLTNRHVMGVNTLTPQNAWRAFDALLRVNRIFFAKEPPGVEDAWRALIDQPESGRNAWTDAYLVAFAIQAGVTLVTFDSQLATGQSAHTHLLR